MSTTQTHEPDEFITIIGADMEAIAREFQAQGLSAKQYAIVHRAGRHRFTQAGTADAPAAPMFDGRPVIAATFRRHAGH